jgi:DNA-binding Lrp family transcriptional regulator
MDPLLKLLKANALTSHEDLSKMLDLPVEDVRARIRAYEEQGVIRGYQAILNERMADEQSVTAIIEVKITPEREGGFNHLAHRIARFPKVSACYLVSGQADLMIFVEGNNLHEVAEFVSEKLSTIQGVTATSTHFLLKKYKHHGLLMEAQDTYERLKVSP